jgi:two-component SAPR family response regulator
LTGNYLDLEGILWGSTKNEDLMILLIQHYDQSWNKKIIWNHARTVQDTWRKLDESIEINVQNALCKIRSILSKLNVDDQ